MGQPRPCAIFPDRYARGLTIVGTKYTDYFTDGTTTVSFAGNPAIDGNLNKPNAKIPSHEGLTWVHTTGGYLYDTPSGDLEIGDYALQPSGPYIQNAPPFVSSTSTPATTASSTNDTAADTLTSTSSSVSPAAPDAAASVPAPSENSSSTMTSSEPAL
jgi:hypothetical protein